MIFVISVVMTAIFTVLSWLEKHTVGGEALFSFFAQLLALIPGLPGSYLRSAYYFGTLDRCSWETHIGLGSLFTHRRSAMGTRASMGSYCIIGHAQIGEEVMMGSRVSVPSGRRQHLDDSGRLTSATIYETVAIGDRTWVGEGAVIMANVGKDCIVSAGAIITKRMPDRCVIGGNPGRVIKELS